MNRWKTFLMVWVGWVISGAALVMFDIDEADRQIQSCVTALFFGALLTYLMKERIRHSHITEAFIRGLRGGTLERDKPIVSPQLYIDEQCACGGQCYSDGKNSICENCGTKEPL